jgi:hypothetical protein
MMITTRNGDALSQVNGTMLIKHLCRLFSLQIKLTSMWMWALTCNSIKSGSVFGSGLEKRQCSLQVCLRGDGEQPRMAIIFRSKGRLTPEEKAAWSPEVDVYFQKNAWADTAVSVEWEERTLSKATKDEKRFVLFCDNLKFKQAIAKQRGVVWYGLANATDCWQPADAGPAQIVKVLTGKAQQLWLEDDENSELRFGHERGFSAKDRRILITHWVGQAWKEFCGEKYNSFRLKSWQKTRCLMTADGSEDDLVKPEGLDGYEIPPPALFEPDVNLPASNTLEGQEEQEPDCGDVTAEDEPQDNAPPPADINDEELLEDLEEDRVFDHEYVGRQIKGLYEDGWALGKISYYNLKFGMFKVDFESDSDFIGLEDIDGIELILLDP